MTGWFDPGDLDASHHLRLSFVVPLVICLGEWMIKRHTVESVTLSWLGVLPRILPPCQVFEPSGRSSALPAQSVIVASTFPNLLVNKYLNHSPDKIHPISALKPYEIKVLRIQSRADLAEQSVWGSHVDPGIQLDIMPQQPTSSGVRGTHIATRRTSAPRKTSLLWPRILNRSATRRFVSAWAFSTYDGLARGSFLLTIGLIIWSVLRNDGMALVSVVLMSFSSSVVGLASKWSPAFDISAFYEGALGWLNVRLNRLLRSHIPRAMTTRPNLDITQGSVIIYIPSRHAFIVVHCTMNVAQSLYSYDANLKHYCVCSKRIYQMLRGVGALLFVFSLLLLASSTWTMQIAVGSTYVLLTCAWQIPGMVLSDNQWVLTHYEVKEEYPPGLDRADKEKPEYAGSERLPSFARTLWYAVRETRETEWIFNGGILPEIRGWRLWSYEARSNIDNPIWPAVASCLRLVTRRGRLLKGMEDLIDDDYDNSSGQDPERSFERQEPQSQSHNQHKGSLEISSIPDW